MTGYFIIGYLLGGGGYVPPLLGLLLAGFVLIGLPFGVYQTLEENLPRWWRPVCTPMAAALLFWPAVALAALYYGGQL